MNILSKNKISKLNLSKLIQGFDYYEEDMNNSDSVNKYDELVLKYPFNESGLLNTDEFDENHVRDFLKIFTKNDVYHADILDLMIDLDNFFAVRVYPILEDKNPEFLGLFSEIGNHKTPLVEWLEFLKELAKPSTVLSTHLDSMDDINDHNYFDGLFEDRKNLSLNFYDNLMVRLLNKKTN